MRTLVREELQRYVRANPPLVEGLLDEQVQIQPHGIDLTVDEVYVIDGVGRIGFASESTVLPQGTRVAFGVDGWVHLPVGTYRIRLAERVHLPKDVYAIARPRSSLLRMGVHVGTALWDAGYSGRGEALLTVHNPHGIWLEHRARVMQLVFFVLDVPPQSGYRGRYWGEG